MPPYSSRINVDRLQPGMYVSELDRPWTETPFLFQGFYVQNQQDIDELKRYCKYVIVESERPLPVEIESGDARSEALNRPAPRRSRREILKNELNRARQYYLEATNRVIHIMNHLRSGGELNAEMAQETVDQLVENVIQTPDAMMWLNRMKKTDEYTYNHSISSSVWAIIFGRHLGLDRREMITVGLGGMLMDVGKTQIHADLLTKSNALTADEYDTVRQHLEHSFRLLKNHRGINSDVLEMVKTHHERHNGGGYPQGLKGDKIPIYGRLAAIVDCYDAMISQRPYAKAVSSFDAMRTLNKLADVDFQSEMVEQFIQAIGVFPTGTLVELNSGDVAVVVSQNQTRRLRPQIMLILDKDKHFRSDFPMIDLQSTKNDPAGHKSLWIVRGLEPGTYGIDPIEFFL